MPGSGPAPSVVTPPQPLVAAVRRLLRPLVKLLLSYSVQYPYLASLLKLTYVEVASTSFALKDKEQTDSRITLLTGIHRQDVKRLRAEMVADAPPPPAVSLGAQLVARWTGMLQYLDAKGHPRPLPKHASEGGIYPLSVLFNRSTRISGREWSWMNGYALELQSWMTRIGLCW